MLKTNQIFTKSFLLNIKTKWALSHLPKYQFYK